jgi:hypothetical protein
VGTTALITKCHGLASAGKEEKDWGWDMGITGREQRERTRGREREGRN